VLNRALIPKIRASGTFKVVHTSIDGYKGGAVSQFLKVAIIPNTVIFTIPLYSLYWMKVHTKNEAALILPTFSLTATALIFKPETTGLVPQGSVSPFDTLIYRIGSNLLAD
jgi:putative effector of murein hydrolase